MAFGDGVGVVPPSWVVCQECGFLDYTTHRFCYNLIHPVADRPYYVKVRWDWEPVLDAAYRLGGIGAALEAMSTLRSL